MKNVDKVEVVEETKINFGFRLQATNLDATKIFQLLLLVQ